jgi:hypothetical protein
MPSSLPAADTIQCKGFTLKSLLAFVDHRWGDEGRSRLSLGLEPELQALTHQAILPGSWYPFTSLVALSVATDRVFGRGDLQLCWEIGRFTSELELNTVHKIFLRVTSFPMWLKTSGIMWGRYYSAGKFELESHEKGKASALLRDFNPVSEAFCTQFSGWMERTMELSGLSRPQVFHPSCVLDGALACRFTGSWEE